MSLDIAVPPLPFSKYLCHILIFSLDLYGKHILGVKITIDCVCLPVELDICATMDLATTIYGPMEYFFTAIASQMLQ